MQSLILSVRIFVYDTLSEEAPGENQSVITQVKSALHLIAPVAPGH